MKKFIFTDNKKLFNRVFAGVLAFFAVAILVATLFVIDSVGPANPKCYHKFILSTFNGSYDKEGMPSSYWQVNAYRNEETGEALPVRLQAELPIQNKAQRYLGQVWINVSDFSGSEIEILTFYGNKNTPLNLEDKPFVLTNKEVRKSKDGWFKVYDSEDVLNFTKAYQYIDDYSITFSNEIKVREIVFIDSEGELIKGATTIDEYIGNQKNNDANNPIKNAVDEYSLFDMNLAK